MKEMRSLAGLVALVSIGCGFESAEPLPHGAQPLDSIDDGRARAIVPTTDRRAPREALLPAKAAAPPRAVTNVQEPARYDAAPTEALDLEPSDVRALEALARAALKSGERQKARAALERWLEVAVDDEQPALLLARLALADGDDDQAGAFAEIARRRNLKSAKPLKGRVLLRAGQLAAATAAFEAAVALDPENAHTLNNLGLCLLRAGEYERAVGPLTRAVELAPSVAHMHNNLGIVEEKLGRTSEALAAYRTALLLEPSYVKAAVNLQHLSRLAEASVPPAQESEPSKPSVVR